MLPYGLWPYDPILSPEPDRSCAKPSGFGFRIVSGFRGLGFRDREKRAKKVSG